MNRKEKLFEIPFEKSMEVRFTYRIGQIVPHQRLLQFIIIRWLFIVIPIHEFIENAGCFESAFSIFVQWPLVLLENNTAMRFGHFELTTVQWETTQWIFQNCKQTGSKRGQVVDKVWTVENLMELMSTHSHPFRSCNCWKTGRYLLVSLHRCSPVCIAVWCGFLSLDRNQYYRVSNGLTWFSMNRKLSTRVSNDFF